MEKLSGILPANSRIRSVDTEDSKPVRPGAPTYGSKEGSSAVKDRVNFSMDAKTASQNLTYNRNPKEASRAKMVEDINRRFFEARVQPKAVDPGVAEAQASSLSESSVLKQLAPQRQSVATGFNFKARSPSVDVPLIDDQMETANALPEPSVTEVEVSGLDVESEISTDEV